MWPKLLQLNNLQRETHHKSEAIIRKQDLLLANASDSARLPLHSTASPTIKYLKKKKSVQKLLQQYNEEINKLKKESKGIKIRSSMLDFPKIIKRFYAPNEVEEEEGKVDAEEPETRNLVQFKIFSF